MALEDFCAKQASEIVQLNRLVCFFFLSSLYGQSDFLFMLAVDYMACHLLFLQVQQYKHERECNFIIAQTREDKILRLESLMDGILPTEDFMEEEFVSLKHEHQVLFLVLMFLYIYSISSMYLNLSSSFFFFFCSC